MQKASTTPAGEIVFPWGERLAVTAVATPAGQLPRPADARYQVTFRTEVNAFGNPHSYPYTVTDTRPDDGSGVWRLVTSHEAVSEAWEAADGLNRPEPDPLEFMPMMVIHDLDGTGLCASDCSGCEYEQDIRDKLARGETLTDQDLF